MSVSYAKPYKGIGMEGAIASWYAKNTRRDLAEFRSLAARLSTQISPGSRILEVAPGPGYLSIELAKRDQYEVTGLDISKSFVEIARKNAAGESVCVDFRRGNASAMPFEDNAFDFVVCRAAFKNFTQPLDAIFEAIPQRRQVMHASALNRASESPKVWSRVRPEVYQEVRGCRM